MINTTIESGHYDAEIIDYLINPTQMLLEIEYFPWFDHPKLIKAQLEGKQWEIVSDRKVKIKIKVENQFCSHMKNKSAIDIGFNNNHFIVWEHEPRTALLFYEKIDYEFLFTELEKKLKWERKYFQMYFDLSQKVPNKGSLPHTIYNATVELLGMTNNKLSDNSYSNLKTLSLDENYVIAENFIFEEEEIVFNDDDIIVKNRF